MGHSLLNGLEAVHGKQECCIEKEKPPRHCTLAASHTTTSKVNGGERTISWMQKKSS